MKKLSFSLGDAGGESEAAFEINFIPDFRVTLAPPLNRVVYVAHSAKHDCYLGVASGVDSDDLLSVAFTQLADNMALRQWMLEQGCSEDTLVQLSAQTSYRLGPPQDLIPAGEQASALTRRLVGKPIMK